MAKAHFGSFSPKLVSMFGFPDSVNGIDIDVISHNKTVSTIIHSFLLHTSESFHSPTACSFSACIS